MHISFLLKIWVPRMKCFLWFLIFNKIFTEVWAHTNFNKIMFLFSKNSETIMPLKPCDE